MIRRHSVKWNIFPGLARRFEQWSEVMPDMNHPWPGPKGTLLVLMTMIIAALLMVLFVSIPPEYISNRTFLGLPMFAWGEAPKAWISLGAQPIGFVAIGGFPVGVLSIGGIPMGIISIGGAAVGLVSLGGLACGLITALGGMSVGYYSFGGFSLGAFAYAGAGVARGYFVAQGGQSERLWGNPE